MFFYLVAQILKLATCTHKKKKSIEERPCVDYWLTLTALLPTWGSQWFVSGMAELLSGRRAYVTGAADNTWVLSWGLGEWPGSLRETERSPQPTASALGGLRGLHLLLGLWTQVCFAGPLIIYEGNIVILFLWNASPRIWDVTYIHTRYRVQMSSTVDQMSSWTGWRHHPLPWGVQQAWLSSQTEKTSANYSIWLSQKCNYLLKIKTQVSEKTRCKKITGLHESHKKKAQKQVTLLSLLQYYFSINTYFIVIILINLNCIPCLVVVVVGIVFVVIKSRQDLVVLVQCVVISLGCGHYPLFTANRDKEHKERNKQ